MSYSQEVLNRVREPKRVGTLDGEHVGTGEVGTLDEGTVVRIQVRKSGDRIEAGVRAVEDIRLRGEAASAEQAGND